jgi:hypothetical protein
MVFELLFGLKCFCLLLVFLWNNGLREAVVTDTIFIFEHFFYSSAGYILSGGKDTVKPIMVEFLQTCV